MRVIMLCLAFLPVSLVGCARTLENENKRTMAMPSSDAVVTIDLTSLGLQDMRLGDDFINTADLAVERRKDPDGAYSFISFTPRPGMSKWITTIVFLPQMDLANGIDWVELDAWNPGVPLRLVVDAADRDADCFEIGFCPNDTVWKGWRKFRVPLTGSGDQGARVSLDRPIHPPVRIKWIIVIMRQGKPWQLGLRGLRIKPRATTDD